MSPGDAEQAPGAAAPAAPAPAGEAPELVTVGRVGKPHGLHGAFFVEGASEDPRRFARGAKLLID